VRVVDAVQYDRRRITYDFDMIENRWDESLSPGNEQAFYWGSAAADVEGTRNYMGVKSPAVDTMIAALLAARERDDFIAAVRALDRVLMSGFYVVPLYHLSEQWVARWNTVAHPAETSLFGYLPETWWRIEPKPSR
jgi:peptide/nickel transport system substrate-binding protein